MCKTHTCIGKPHLGNHPPPHAASVALPVPILAPACRRCSGNNMYKQRSFAVPTNLLTSTCYCCVVPGCVLRRLLSCLLSAVWSSLFVSSVNEGVISHAHIPTISGAPTAFPWLTTPLDVAQHLGTMCVVQQTSNSTKFNKDLLSDNERAYLTDVSAYTRL